MLSPYIGTAAWNIPKDFSGLFPTEGSHLERYAQILNAVEINSSFYKDHKPATYAKWAASTPTHFRFSVKLAKQFTHLQKLEVRRAELEEKLRGIQELGPKLGALLVQIPPSLKLQTAVADLFFKRLRQCYQGPLAFEPRHPTWLSSEGLLLMNEYAIGKVIADPDPCPSEGVFTPGSDLIYYRLHGSPEIYKSNYEKNILEKISQEMTDFTSAGKLCWCIFDNTTFGYATANAVEVKHLLEVGLKRQRGIPGTWDSSLGHES